MPKKEDPKLLRERQMLGWAFRDFNGKECEAIRTYIATGVITDDMPQLYKDQLARMGVTDGQ